MFTTRVARESVNYIKIKFKNRTKLFNLSSFSITQYLFKTNGRSHFDLGQFDIKQKKLIIDQSIKISKVKIKNVNTILKKNIIHPIYQ